MTRNDVAGCLLFIVLVGVGVIGLFALAMLIQYLIGG